MTTGEQLRDSEAQARSDAARMMGRVRSERKTAAARINAQKAGRKIKPLAEITCTCGRGAALEHPTTCPRGRVIRYRTKKGLPLT